MISRSLRKLAAAALLAALSGGFTTASAQDEKEPSAEAAEASEPSEPSGAAASDPTAGVNYLDIKPRWFDLPKDNEETVVEIEGVYSFDPSFTLKYELIATQTNRSGETERGFREFKLRPLYLHPIQPLGIKAKFGVGVEWFKDLGQSKDGTGTGTDTIAPLVGIGWLPTDKDFLVTLVQYFHSYEEDDNIDTVRATGPRLIYIRSISAINGWAKADLRTRIDHSDGDDFSQTLELQVGTMIADQVGIFQETFIGDSLLDTNEYNWGVGFGVRILY